MMGGLDARRFQLAARSLRRHPERSYRLNLVPVTLSEGLFSPLS